MPKKRMTIDDLALMTRQPAGVAPKKERQRLMTQRGFARQGERIDRLEEKIDKLASVVTQLAMAVKDGFASINARLDLIRQDISDNVFGTEALFLLNNP